MKNKSIIFISIILMLSLCGCDSLLIKKNSVILYESTSQENDSQAEIQILEYETISQGIVYDYTEYFDSIIYSKKTAQNVLNLFIYNVENNTSESIISDIKNNVEAIYDPISNGIYYKEVNNKTARLMWTDLNKERTVGLTELIDSQNLCWTLSKDGTLLYSLGDGRIYFATNDGINNIYNISTNVVIKKIRYLSDDKNVIFLTQDIQTNSNILYKMSLTEEKKTLLPIEINVSQFDINEENNMTVYLQSVTSGNSILYAYNNTTGTKKRLYKGNISEISISPNNEYAAITTNPTETTSVKSLWLLSLKNDFEPYQLIVDIDVSGNIKWKDNENTIYLSVKETENDEETFEIKKLKFKIKEN